MRDLESLISYYYRTYRAFTIPYNDCTVYELREEREGKEWINLLESLKRFLIDSKAAYERLDDPANSLADLMVFFFKAPLLADPLQGLLPSPAKLYFLTRFPVEYGGEKLTTLLDIDDPLNMGNLRKAIEYLEVIEKTDYWNPIKTLYSTQVREQVIKAWLVYPADTRPGYNASSLISHLLTTSSLAWINSYTKTPSTLDLEQQGIVRLAAILHDMAKPINPQRHTERKIVEPLAINLLDGLLDDNTVKKVINLAIRHHEVDFLREADAFAASVDRVTRMVRHILGGYFERNEFSRIAAEISNGAERGAFNIAYGRGELAWKFWMRVDNEYDGLIREMSEVFAKSLIEKPEEVLRAVGGDERGRSLNHARYFLIDLGGIQDFIRSTNKLRTVAASSQIIDLLIYFIIPYYLQSILKRVKQIWLPLENFYVTGGGNIAAVMPEILRDAVKEALEGLDKYLRDRKRLSLSLRHASCSLMQSTPQLLEEIAKEMALAKITQKQECSEMTPPKRQDELCKICYTRRVDDDLKERGLCRNCAELDEFGENMAFHKKWTKGFILEEDTERIKIRPERLWSSHNVEEYGEYVMEIIAGIGDIEEIREGVRMPNYACIKGDGNNMGRFIQQSFSLSELIEKNFRIDIAMKRAYEEALKNVAVAVKGDEGLRNAARIWLGTIYVGGDDFLMFTPSWAAFPIAYTMANRFKKEMGYRCTLSLGIAAVYPKHSVWHAIGAADKMLDKAKEASRKDNREAICFDVLEQSLLTERTAETRLRMMTELGLTLRPMKLSVTNNDDITLQQLLSKLLGNQEISSPKELTELASTCFYNAKKGEETTGEGKRIDEIVKGYRRQVREIISVTKKMLKDLNSDNKLHFLTLAVIYCFRQAARMEDLGERASSEVYRTLGNLITTQLNNNKASSPLMDIDLAAKIIGGGMI